MADDRTSFSVDSTIIEETSGFTFIELCRACGASTDEVSSWVMEGVLEPVGQGPADWCFTGHALRRACLARRFARELELNAPGVALALDLLDEIDALKARLRRAGLPAD
ncbi:MAG: MerR family transcriptional regulator [Rhizobacter sp.]|nr:MerR family transcriptional regulator [Rhizobacter sp.]